MRSKLRIVFLICIICFLGQANPANAKTTSPYTYDEYQKKMEEYISYKNRCESRITEIRSEGEIYYGTEEDFYNDISPINKDISDVQRKLSAIANDTSLSAAAKRARLEAELATLNAESDYMWECLSRASQIRACENEIKYFYTSAFGECSASDYEHLMGIWTTEKSESCEQDGEKRYKCFLCDYYAYETIPATGHSFIHYISDNNATCCKDGSKTAVCKNCDVMDTIIDLGTILPHRWGVWSEVESPTFDSSSKITRICADCGTEESQTINNPFIDVRLGEFYTFPVLWAVEESITSGMTETTFEPDGTCTRAQIVTFLWRACGSPKVGSTNPFTDVPADAWYADAVLWAVEKGITSGMGDGSFAPGAPCTRGQVATFLWRACGQPAPSGTNIFTDIAPGAYYYDAVLWAVENGITNGMGDGTFAPDAPCTRGQIVTFLYRAMA